MNPDAVLKVLSDKRLAVCEVQIITRSTYQTIREIPWKNMMDGGSHDRCKKKLGAVLIQGGESSYRSMRSRNT